jgi:hypothetical protein
MAASTIQSPWFATVNLLARINSARAEVEMNHDGASGVYAMFSDDFKTQAAVRVSSPGESHSSLSHISSADIVPNAVREGRSRAACDTRGRSTRSARRHIAT